MAIQIPLSSIPDKPLVSILLANFNYARFIKEAIESVLFQTYQRYELIVCDDGSSDNSCEIIKRYVGIDPRVVLIQKSNGGQASAINRAFIESTGDIICMLDADDIFDLNKLSKVVEAFNKNPAAGMAIHNLEIINEKGQKKHTTHFRLSGYLGPEIPTLRMGLPIPQASGLSFRREILEEILPLPEDRFQSVADWAIGYIAAYLTITANLPEPLARYRVHKNSLSGTTSSSRSLDLKKIENILKGMEKVISYVDWIMQTKYGISVSAEKVRNILEHRIILGFLKKDKILVASSIDSLSAAFKCVRRDYPIPRYFFWRILSELPASLTPYALYFSFICFKFLARAKRIFAN